MLSPAKKLNPVKIKTGPWPAFATDNMPMILAVLTKVPGKSQIEETIFSNRFMSAPELNRMGASIRIKKNKAIIIGKKNLMQQIVFLQILEQPFQSLLVQLQQKVLVRLKEFTMV